MPSFHRNKIRTFLVVCGLMGSVSLTGCTQSPDPDVASNTTGRGPITFAMGKNDTGKLIPIIESWNEAHPNEKVTLMELAGEADAQRDTLVQSLQSGSSDYDVMALDVPWTADFAAHQWLTPLTGDLAVDTNKLLDAPVKSATYHSTLYALPQNTNGQLLYRNTELIPEAPKNWDELRKSCQKMKETHPDKDCLILQGKQYEGLTVSTLNFIEGWGGEVMDSNGKPLVDSDKAKEGLQAMVDAYKDGAIAQSAISATEEETYLAFTRGEVAYAVNWPYMYAEAETNGSQVQGKFDVQPLVAKDGLGVSTLGGYNNAININSPHKATALDFMKFITNIDNQTALAEESFPPVLAAIYDDAELIEKHPYLPALKISLENAQPRPVNPYYAAISKAIQDNSYAALTSDKSVEDATSDMKAAIENAARL